MSHDPRAGVNPEGAGTGTLMSSVRLRVRTMSRSREASRGVVYSWPHRYSGRVECVSTLK
jgi:hypothetical protein